MSNEFSPFAVMQEVSHCGPCSLSSCLFMLGTEVTQRDVAWAAGKPYRVFREGMTDRELARAGRRYGAVTEGTAGYHKRDGRAFSRVVQRHLQQHGPAILLTMDYMHWVAVVGYLAAKRQFIVYDPADAEPFIRWGHSRLIRETWNISPYEGEPSLYFALLIRRKDGKPPMWHVTEDWMRIHNRGSDCTAGTIATDLESLVKACGGRNSGSGISLARMMEKCRGPVLCAITSWSEGEGYQVQDLRDLYSDYSACAEACSIEFPAGADQTAFVAGLTALLSAYWWGGEME